MAREDQPADLPTKLHSRARLLHLLGTWGIVGLAGLDEGKVLKCLKLGCMFLLLLAVQSLAVSAAKDPLPVTGTMELYFGSGSVRSWESTGFVGLSEGMPIQALKEDSQAEGTGKDRG